jgi:hypothetical protein
VFDTRAWRDVLRVLTGEGVGGGDRLLTLRWRLRSGLRRGLGVLSRDDVHRRQILAGEAVVLFTWLVQEHAIAVGALFVAQIGRAILGCAELSSQDPIAVLRAVDGGDARGGVLLPSVRNVDADGLRVDVVLGLTDNYLDNLAVLTEILIATECLEQFVFLNSRAQTSHINQVLLHDAEASKMLAGKGVGLALLGFLLGGGGLLLLLCGLFGSPESFPVMGVSVGA